MQRSVQQRRLRNAGSRPLMRGVGRHWSDRGGRNEFRNHVPRMRIHRRRKNALRRVHLLLRMQRVSQNAKTTARRLLRVLFVCKRQMSTYAVRKGLLCVARRPNDAQPGAGSDRPPAASGRTAFTLGLNNSCRVAGYTELMSRKDALWHLEEFFWEFLVVTIMLGLMAGLGWLVDLAARLSEEESSK